AMVARGARSMLTWTVRHASRLELKANGVALELPGSRALEGGQLEVFPLENTTYIMTATGPGGQVTEEVSITVRTPTEIVSFVVEPEQIPLGGEAVLRWETEGVESIQLHDSQGPLPVASALMEQGEVRVSPERSQVYTLTVQGASGQVREERVRLRVVQPAEIISFAANPNRARAGESVALRWETQGADEVSLWVGEQRLDTGALEPSSGAWMTVVERSTTFRLVAKGEGGETEAETALDVIAPVSVDLLEADPPVVDPGGSSVLYWETTGATQVALAEVDTGRPLPIDAEGVDGEWRVTPAERTRYALTVQGPGGTVTREVEVDVRLEGPLRVVNFTVEPELIEPGQEALLSWQVSGAQSVSIEASPGSLLEPGDVSPLTGTLSVSPEQTTRYLLRALGSEGMVEEEVTLTVNRAVEIVRFDAEPEIVARGEPTTIHWMVQNAALVELMVEGQDPEEVEPQGARTFNELSETTELRLVASGLGGEVERHLTIRVEEFGLVDMLDEAVEDPQLAQGRRRGPEIGGNAVVLVGYNLDRWPLRVWFGEVEAACEVTPVEEFPYGDDVGLMCTVPEGQGRVDLSLESPYVTQLYPRWYTYEPIDRCALSGPVVVASEAGEHETFTGWVYEPGLTDSPEEALVVSEWGFGPEGSDPAWPGAGWTWRQAGLVQCDEDCQGLSMVLETELPGPGQFSHAFRVRPLQSDLWTYCDSDGTLNDTFATDTNAFDLEATGVLSTQ
ncbi:MAG: hypothetical protein AAFX99_00400, partial [Myxococcota bacterium]